MAKLKTMIIYASTTAIAGLVADVKEARERGQAIRLIETEEFRGETEQNAGAVYVARRAGDELLFSAIQQAYPHLEVQNYGSGPNLDDFKSFEHVEPDPDVKALRLELVAIGGSAPAGAGPDELRELIAAQRLHMHKVPVLPTPATQGTTIPNPTPIVQRPDGDKLVEEGATGLSPALAAASEAETGEGTSGTGTAAASGSIPAGTAGDQGGASGGDDANGRTGLREGFDAEAFIGRGLDDISADEIAGLSADEKAAVIAAENDRERPRVGLLRSLGAED